MPVLLKDYWYCLHYSAICTDLINGDFDLELSLGVQVTDGDGVVVEQVAPVSVFIGVCALIELLGCSTPRRFSVFLLLTFKFFVFLTSPVEKNKLSELTELVSLAWLAPLPLPVPPSLPKKGETVSTKTVESQYNYMVFVSGRYIVIVKLLLQ